MKKAFTGREVATKVYIDALGGSVTYHGTHVLYLSRGEKDCVALSTGGWVTQTTKKRINQGFHLFNLPLHLFQKNFAWYIHTPAGEVEWKNPGERDLILRLSSGGVAAFTVPCGEGITRISSPPEDLPNPFGGKEV